MPITESQWVDLTDRVGALERVVSVVETSNTHLTEQLAEITVAQHRADQQRRAMSDRMDKLERSIAANTELTERTLAATEAVRDVVITARTGGRFVKWLAPTLIAVGVAVGVVKGWWLAGVEVFSSSQIQPPR